LRRRGYVQPVLEAAQRGLATPWPVMRMMRSRIVKRGLALAALALLAIQPVSAQRGPGRSGPTDGAAQQGEAPSRAPATPPRAYPADQTTNHTIALPSGPFGFAATAGSIRLSNAQSGEPLADIAYIAFQKPGADPKTRPVTFLFNGGPGYASGWLNLGAIGPWRLRMDGDAATPSAAPVVADNPETWLTFTDLVFIDPPGTGYGRILGNDEVRRNLWSVNGDLNALATTIRRWTEQNNRGLSPKFVGGESYGGFRAPKIAHILQTDQGVGVSGIIMLSPVLDFGRFNSNSQLWQLVARLPSYAAAAREAKGEVTRADLADVESYATGEFLSDLLRGPRDEAAIARLAERVSQLTGLDKNLVRQLGGRISQDTFARELNRNEGRVASSYDARVLGFDPYPQSARTDFDDQLRLGLHAPITQAMVDLYRNKLKWVVENGRYLFMNEEAGRQWNWGNRPAEATGDLRRAMALDPHLKVFASHGLTDLVTPYFETKMLLDQLPAYGAASRVQFKVYPGGHMFYTREASRRAFRDDARAMIAPE
jgi:carboxypeptidase C (cathepsin A)